MNKINKSGFSLIELLVVITILAIISVVAYTNFSGSTGKAKNSKKLQDITSIETGLQTFYQDKYYYPMPSASTATNVWWVDLTKPASLNNTINTTSGAGGEINTLNSWSGWWLVYLSWTVTAVWAKWVMDSSVLNKQYLSQELYDPSLKDIKLTTTNNTFKDYWVWKYVYWVYTKITPTSGSKKWQAYNVAVTLTDDQKWYISKIIWNFDASTCTNCPDSLIWSGTAWINLKDWNSSMTGSYSDSNERIPYPVDWF
ncbi:MAG: hypothetical protein ACD_49C00038G0065 [uncultured bacterium (gcode 4)]|uniref:Prepilin-type N-terminal cleavage/methylation domain-containing protein n=1 Tax=uncultured bacterium (gcode 4) TaxID=1234023 RepID=K2AXM7_9BACT|nr:MAG: hypothetical protein ACD_49C00038G0065 [uncultured bacterium (gcode 4)]